MKYTSCLILLVFIACGQNFSHGPGNELTPSFYSKCESWNDFVNPEIYDPSFPPETEVSSGSPQLTVSLNGKIGNCICLSGNGTAQKLLPFGKNRRISDKHAISFWFRFSNSGNDRQHIPIHADLVVNPADYRIMATTDSILNCNIVVNNNYYDDTANEIADTNWHHYYIAVDKNCGLSGNKSIKVFLDNNLYMEADNTIDDWGVGFQMFLQNSTSPAGFIYLDNIKIWEGNIIENPSREYNFGNGLEE